MYDEDKALRESPGTLPKCPSLVARFQVIHQTILALTSPVSLQGHKGTLEVPMPASTRGLSHLAQDPGLITGHQVCVVQNGADDPL